MWTTKDTGSLLTGIGSFYKAAGGIEEARSVSAITTMNAATRLDDMRQLTKSLRDNTRQLTRGSRKAAGRLRTAVAASNLVMEGSPLMAMEELHQQGIADIEAIQEQARYKHKAMSKTMEMDYLSTISELKGKEKALWGKTLGAMGKGFTGGWS
jgi:hypothetical protein